MTFVDPNINYKNIGLTCDTPVHFRFIFAFAIFLHPVVTMSCFDNR